MTTPNSDLLLAQALAGPDPLGYKLRPDGSMCVVDRAGRKLVFSPAQVAAAGAKIAGARVPAPSAGRTAAGKSSPQISPKKPALPNAKPVEAKPPSSKKPVAPTATKQGTKQ